MSTSKRSSAKPSKSKLNDERFMNIFDSCIKLLFGSDKRKHPRYLNSLTSRRTRSTNFKLQKGRAASVICYNPDWLDKQYNEEGTFNPCNVVDYVLKYMKKLKEGKKR
jgi:hypothetical protein